MNAIALPDRVPVEWYACTQQVSPALCHQPGLWPKHNGGASTMGTLPSDEFAAFIARHVKNCDNPLHCLDCALARDRRALSLITIARREVQIHAEYLAAWDPICTYCAAPSTSVDHLVPLPWTGSGARPFVPTVPACRDCNVRINAAIAPTIHERSLIVATSLRHRHRKKLAIPDRGIEQLAEFGERMRINIAAAQARRQEVRRRLIVLDAGGSPYVPTSMLNRMVLGESA